MSDLSSPAAVAKSLRIATNHRAHKVFAEHERYRKRYFREINDTINGTDYLVGIAKDDPAWVYYLQTPPHKIMKLPKVELTEDVLDGFKSKSPTKADRLPSYWPKGARTQLPDLTSWKIRRQNLARDKNTQLNSVERLGVYHPKKLYQNSEENYEDVLVEKFNENQEENAEGMQKGKTEIPRSRERTHSERKEPKTQLVITPNAVINADSPSADKDDGFIIEEFENMRKELENNNVSKRLTFEDDSPQQPSGSNNDDEKIQNYKVGYDFNPDIYNKYQILKEKGLLNDVPIISTDNNDNDNNNEANTQDNNASSNELEEEEETFSQNYDQPNEDEQNIVTGEVQADEEEEEFAEENAQNFQDEDEQLCIDRNHSLEEEVDHENENIVDDGFSGQIQQSNQNEDAVEEEEEEEQQEQQLQQEEQQDLTKEEFDEEEQSVEIIEEQLEYEEEVEYEVEALTNSIEEEDDNDERSEEESTNDVILDINLQNSNEIEDEVNRHRAGSTTSNRILTDIDEINAINDENDDYDTRPANCGNSEFGFAELVVEINVPDFLGLCSANLGKEIDDLTKVPTSEYEKLKELGFGYVYFVGLPHHSSIEQISLLLSKIELRLIIDFNETIDASSADGVRFYIPVTEDIRQAFPNKILIGSEETEFANYFFDERPISCLRNSDCSGFMQIIMDGGIEKQRRIVRYMSSKGLYFNSRSTRTAAAMILTLPGIRIINYSELSLLDRLKNVINKKSIIRGVFEYSNISSNGNMVSWKYSRGRQHLLITANFEKRQTTGHIICPDCPDELEKAKYVDTLTETTYLRYPFEMKEDGLCVILYEYEAQIFHY